LQGLIKLST